MKSTPDLTIIKRVLAGEADAFAELITRYRDYVFSVAARHVPEEAVPETAHEVFVGAFKSLSGYTPDRPFDHWLYRIAVRCSYDYWRSVYRRKEVSLTRTLSNAVVFEGGSPGEHYEYRELLEKILEKLNPEDRMVMTLVHFEERTVAETARILGWKESKVKVRAHRARKYLRDRLKTLVEKGF